MDSFIYVFQRFQGPYKIISFIAKVFHSPGSCVVP